jgi:uncharacterized protein
MSAERPPLDEMTLRQLRRVASEYGISRYSRMRKDQLLSSIQEAQRNRLPNSPRTLEAQAEVAAAKFDVGQSDRVGVSFTAVDEGLAELPDGYGESRIVLMPRDPQWAYAYWDIPNSQKEDLRRQGGLRLALRFYDVTDINVDFQRPHSLQQYECDEMAREWYLPVPVSDREYMIEIGYLTGDGRWLLLSRSLPTRIPPVYPSDWIEDQFLTIAWDEDLRGKTYLQLTHPNVVKRSAETPIYERIFAMTQSAEAQRVAGSLFGSMHQVPEESVSSYVLASGAGMWATAVPTTSGVGMSGAGMSVTGMSGVGMSGVGMSVTGMSGIGMMSGVGMMGMNMSGIGMSGIGMMSGVGFSASAPPIRPRQFWLVADAELIVYGATEPDATVTIGGQPVKLNSDGTFRFQMSFQDGVIDFPVFAVAADGEQNRSVHLKFERETPERRTNTKEEAVPEWLS